MTLPTREDAQAVGRPLFDQALQAQGVPIRVIRVGQETELTGIIVPVTPDGKRAIKIDDPEFAQETVKFFFRYDADAVRTPGFNLLRGNRLYTPTSPTVDAADQGVALMLVAQPLVERTRAEQLVFTLPGSGTIRDAKGNLVPAPGIPLPIVARLVATNDPKIRESVGADAASVVLVGRWGSLTRPLLKPDGVMWGSTSPLTLDGQKGVLTVKLAYPDPDLTQESQFGARFIAVWKAGA